MRIVKEKIGEMKKVCENGVEYKYEVIRNIKVYGEQSKENDGYYMLCNGWICFTCKSEKRMRKEMESYGF